MQQIGVVQAKNAPFCWLPMQQNIALLGSMNNIKHLRRKAGLSQTKLAELMGTTYQQVQKLEAKDVSALKLDWITRLCAALSVTREELLGDITDAPPAEAQVSIEIVAAIAAHAAAAAREHKFLPATLRRIVESAVADSGGLSHEEALRNTETIIKHELRILADTNEKKASSK